MTQKIIELKNVTKTFQFSSPSTKNNFLSSSNFRKSKKTVIALDNVSFSVDRGEILGIIGLNGSGKSTLLQTIAGLYLPDSGYVGVNGTLAPVLTIGAGFNQELLPTENIVLCFYLQGRLMGDPSGELNERACPSISSVPPPGGASPEVKRVPFRPVRTMSLSR